MYTGKKLKFLYSNFTYNSFTISKETINYGHEFIDFFYIHAGIYRTVVEIVV